MGANYADSMKDTKLKVEWLGFSPPDLVVLDFALGYLDGFVLEIFCADIFTSLNKVNK